MLSIHKKAIPNPDVIATELEDEAVLLHLDTKMYYSLNSTGLRIWNLLNQNLSLNEIAECIQHEFDISREKAEESVLKLVDSLFTEKLVTLDAN